MQSVITVNNNTQTGALPDVELVAQLVNRMASAGIKFEPTDAFGTIDTQNDFCPKYGTRTEDGSLAVPKGDEIVPVTNAFASLFTSVMKGFQPSGPTDANGWDRRFFTRCKHRPDPNQPHFQKHPPHCVDGTEGCKFHSDLTIGPKSVIFSKGKGDADDYNGFDGRLDDELSEFDGMPLEHFLNTHNVVRIFFTGLATEYCDEATIMGALDRGFEVVVLTDGIKALDPVEGDKAIERMKASGAIFI